MTMQLSVYVGPYIVAERCGEICKLVEDYGHLVCDGRMEMAYSGGKPEPLLYIIPSVKMLYIDRQMKFSRDDETTVCQITGDDRKAEIESFRLLAARFTDRLSSIGQQYQIAWGVVCCYS